MRTTGLLPMFGTPSFHAVCLTLATAAAIQALIAIWAATSRQHWFWRALAVWAAIMALAPIRAYEPALIFAISSPLTAAIIIAQQKRSGRIAMDREANHGQSANIRFTLRDLLLFMVIVGLSLAGVLHLLRNTHHPILTNYALNLAAITAVSLCAHACVFANRRLVAACLLLLAIAAFAYAIPTLGSPPEAYDSLSVLDVGFGTLLAASFRNLALALGEFAILIVVGLSLVQASTRTTPAAPRQAIRFALALVAALFVAPLAAIYWQMLWLSPLLPAFSDEPNHFPRLLEIAQRTKELRSAAPGTADERERMIADVVLLAEAANYVPSDPDPNPSRVNLDDYVENTSARTFRDLARAIEDEASSAFSRGDETSALKLRLTILRLGVMLQRGAEVAMYNIGRAVEGVALERFIQNRRDLAPAEARAALRALERTNAEREGPEIACQRDRAAAERAYGWGCRLNNVLERAGFGSDVYPAFVLVSRNRQQLIRLLQTDLALRLYHHDHGQFPPTLADLVPDYLPEVPIDLHSHQPVRYRAGDDDFTLYSVGQDRIDNGGKFTNIRAYYSGIDKGDHTHFGAGYDLDLDTQTRP